MTDDDDGEDQAAQAFEKLRAEVSLMRRAVERLAVERAEVSDAPDYSETLGVMSRNLTATAQRVDALVKSPALTLTPEEITRQIGAAGYTVRREDQRQFAAARQALEEMTAKIGRQLHSHIEAGEQRRRLGHAGLVGLVAGMAVWAVLPGPIARAMPESWHWPERMAARSLRLDTWGASQRLAAISQPGTWNTMIRGAIMVQDNQSVIERCVKAASKTREPVSCTVRIRLEKTHGYDGV